MRPMTALTTVLAATGSFAPARAQATRANANANANATAFDGPSPSGNSSAKGNSTAPQNPPPPCPADQAGGAPMLGAVAIPIVLSLVGGVTSRVFAGDVNGRRKLAAAASQIAMTPIGGAEVARAAVADDPDAAAALPAAALAASARTRNGPKLLNKNLFTAVGMVGGLTIGGLIATVPLAVKVIRPQDKAIDADCVDTSLSHSTE